MHPTWPHLLFHPRQILRQEMRAAAPGPGGAPRASWRVSSTLVFVKSVNGLLKGMVEKGEAVVAAGLGS